MKLKLDKNDRICFLGDSITADGIWVAEIIEYFIKHYPELKIGFYNCGISGTRGYRANEANRLYCDCFNLYPKYVVIMFGMNDAEPQLYNPREETEDRIRKRDALRFRYENTLERLIDLCKKAQTIPILCTPTPYDAYTESATENWYADTALEYFKNVAADVARRYHIMLIDMRSILMEHMDKNPIRADRVHPNEYGSHLMSEFFLHEIGAKPEIEIDKKCELSEKNRRRYEIEQIIRAIMFIERDYMGWTEGKTQRYTLVQRKRLLKKRVDAEPQNEYIDKMVRTYVKYADFKEELKGELIKRTAELYE